MFFGGQRLREQAAAGAAKASADKHVEPEDANPAASFEPSWQRSLSSDPQHLAPTCSS